MMAQIRTRIRRGALRWLIPAALLVIPLVPAASQSLAANLQRSEATQDPKTLSLKAALAELESRFKVVLAYKDNLVLNQTVSSQQWQQQAGFEASIRLLLSPFNLTYKKVGKDTYVIKPAQPGKPAATGATGPEDSTRVSPVGVQPGTPPAGAAAAVFVVTGRVTNDKGEGLPGVSVLLKGTTTGNATQIDGTYSITIPDGNGVLVFSFIGYATEEVPVSNRTRIDVSLLPDIKSLNEVVVVGYGTQKKADVTGATATITARDFNTGVINNPLQAVQGKVAGLNISSSNSDPTNNRPVIRLRGIGSLTANAEPLIVIDGVLGASLNSVAPEDIEKFDVLKDASAAAIYGARGANGVIIVTTKRGKAGRTAVDYNTYAGFDSPYRLPDVLTPDEYFNRFNELNSDNPSAATARTDWFREITRTAVSMNHSLGISGGSENFNYRGSVAYLKQPGIALRSEQDRLNARLNLTQYAVDKRLEAQLNVSANLYDKQFIDYGAFTRAVVYSPLEPVYNPDGTFNAPADLPFIFQNPVAMLRQPVNEGKDKQLLGNLKLFFEVIKGLRAGLNTSYSVFNSASGYFRPRAVFNQNGQTNTNISFGRRDANQVHDRLVEYTLAYNNAWGRHNFGVLAGYTYQYLTTEGFGLSASDFPDQFAYNNLGAADQELNKNNIYSYKAESKLDGLLARINYSYADKYLLTANFRRDGSSRFGANNRYGYFPAFSVGWRVSEEAFMKGISAISDLKLRVGYGVTGNQNGIGDYASRLLIGPGGNYASPTTDPSNPITYKTAYFFSQNANPDLKWESSAMTNIGVDFGLFAGRLSGSVELYNKDTRNLLFNYSVNPGDKYGEGLTYITNSFLANIGSMNNKGIEFSLDFLAIERNNFEWRTALNAAHNVNKVVRLSGEGLTFPEEGIRYGTIYAGQNGYGPYSVLKEGLPVGTFWAPREVSLNDKGEPLYEVIDKNTGAVLDPTTDHGKATRQNLGSAQPKVTLGWTNSFTLGNFDLSVFFRSALGQKVYNAANMVFNNPTTFRAGDKYPNNVYASAFAGGNANLAIPGAVSSRYVENASFVRLDNATLGYTLSLQAGWIRSLRVYAAGQNLWLLTKYKGLDPEVRSGATTNEYGGVNNTFDNLAFGLDDFFFYPRARTITIGLSAGF